MKAKQVMPTITGSRRGNERIDSVGDINRRTADDDEGGGVLKSLAYYDELRARANPVTRVGNVDVLSSISDEQVNVATCHLAGIFNFRVVDDDDNDDETLFWLAVEQAAIIALAAEHLNSGDGSIVPQVDGLNDRCDVRFTVEYADTEYHPHRAINEAIRLTDRPADGPLPLPCAFLGAKRSYVSIPTAVITGLREYPQISPWSTMPALDDKSKYPLFGRTVPSDRGTAVAVVLALREHFRVRHLAVLHVDDSYATAFASGLQSAALEHAPDMVVTPVDMPFRPSDEDIQRTVRNLKNTQFRYIFCILYVGPSRVQTLLGEAHRQGIAGTGQHTWLFSDAVGTTPTWDAHAAGSPMHRALRGAGLIQATGGLPRSPRRAALAQRLRALRSKEDLGYVLSKSPFRNLTGDDGAAALEGILDRWFFNGESEPYSPFLYDAVIATGLAACDAASASPSADYFGGPAHFNAFTRTSFDGASGRVVMDPETGTRVATSAHFSLTNFVEEVTNNAGANQSVQFKAVQSASFESGAWVELTPFVYADGSNTPPPDLPPTTVDENLLQPGWRASGLVLCAAALLLAMGFAGWTRWKRESRVVRASQPVFLYLICVGVFVFASSIIPLSFDEGISSAEGCSIACTSFPWLISIGFAVTFSALFTKTYRVNVIFQSASRYRRIVVAPWDVAKPMLFTLGGNMVVLSLMTALSPLEWEVEVVARDSFSRPIETRGFCNWQDTIPYIAALGAMNFGCLAFSVHQAFQARHVSTEYAETEYIFKAMLAGLLACFLGFPVLILTKDIPAAYYFVLAAIIFVISCSVLLLIFAPKVSAFLKSKDQFESRVSVSFGDLSSDSLSAADHSGLRILMPKRERALSEKVQSLTDDLHEAEMRIEELTALNQKLRAPTSSSTTFPNTDEHSSTRETEETEESEQPPYVCAE